MGDRHSPSARIAASGGVTTLATDQGLPHVAVLAAHVELQLCSRLLRDRQVDIALEPAQHIGRELLG